MGPRIGVEPVDKKDLPKACLAVDESRRVRPLHSPIADCGGAKRGVPLARLRQRRQRSAYEAQIKNPNLFFQSNECDWPGGMFN